MRIITDTLGHYVERRGDGFSVTARRGQLTITACVLSTPRQVEEFTEALAAGARDASRLQGKPKYRPASVRKPKEGWPIAMMEIK